MRRLPQQQRNPRVRRERDTAALRRQVVLLACGLTVTFGFVASVGQQYAAVRYGYASEKLREERKQLLAERERLLLELSVAESPVTLERAARDIGMQPARPSQIGTSRREAAQDTPAADAEGAGAREAAAKTGARGATKAGGESADAGASAKRRRGVADDGDERETKAGAAVVRDGSRSPQGSRGLRGDSRPRIVEVSGKGR